MHSCIGVAKKRDAARRPPGVEAPDKALLETRSMSITHEREEKAPARHDESEIEDVRYLEVSDCVRLNGRQRPLTVTATGTRTRETIIAERPVMQHLVELEGEWEDAVTYVIANCVDAWSGVELQEQRSLAGGPTGVVELTLVGMEGL